jgi:PIN domain nuclease of toxin-antitoxin system
VRLLLDTHTLLWWLADDPALSRGAAEAIAGAAVVAVSAASAWEISIKQALGKLTGPADLAAELRANEMVALPVTVEHSTAAGALPHLHSDPFDRMLVAQARAEDLTLVTRDPRLAPYGIPVLRA